MVVGVTADTEQARDGAFTPALIAALQANPDLSLDEMLRHLAVTPMPWGPSSRAMQHPTLVQYGQVAQAQAQGDAEGRPRGKQAVLIANSEYEHATDLDGPPREASGMQSQLASRGYDVQVHHNKTSDDMGSLWSTMVSAARRGDELVAHYGGHGVPAGLLGVNHARPPGPSDLFTPAQVSGVVSAATGKGAQIRFILDSCYSGATVQTVREERQNELAAASSGSIGDQLRVQAMEDLTELKQQLLAMRGQRRGATDELDRAIEHHRATAPDPTDAQATQAWEKIGRKLDDVRTARLVDSGEYRDEAGRLWAESAARLEVIRMIAHHPAPPPPISSYHLGAQLNYLDDLWNALSHPMEQARGEAPAPAGGGQAP
jgi:hypothetical protein